MSSSFFCALGPPAGDWAATDESADAAQSTNQPSLR
jgi:hypothetical protein